jgi:L,D-transpeptidase catalytic domain
MITTTVLVAMLMQGPAFRFEPIPKTATELTGRFTADQIAVLEMLNRRDQVHLLRADPKGPGLLVPVTWAEDLLAYSPFPASWPASADAPKSLVVSQPLQAFAAYEHGKLVRWGPVSTGRQQTQTPEGRYNLTWRSRKRRSTDNQEWLLEWYFNFVNERGVSFHLFELPGYPASHACVRLLQRDAQWIYEWGEQWTLDANRKMTAPGTPVWILGTYTFGKPPAWLTVDVLPVVALPQ